MSLVQLINMEILYNGTFIFSFSIGNNNNFNMGKKIMNKEQLITNFKTRLNNMVLKYPDLAKFDLTGNKFGNDLFKSDPVRYNVLFSNNPVVKFDKYTRVVAALKETWEDDIVEVLKSYDLYSYVNKIEKNKQKRGYTK